MSVVIFPKKKRGCCEMVRQSDGSVSWCEATPTRKVSYVEIDHQVGGEVAGGLTVDKFWCEEHAPEFAEEFDH